MLRQLSKRQRTLDIGHFQSVCGSILILKYLYIIMSSTGWRAHLQTATQKLASYVRKKVMNVLVKLSACVFVNKKITEVYILDIWPICLS